MIDCIIISECWHRVAINLHLTVVIFQCAKSLPIYKWITNSSKYDSSNKYDSSKYDSYLLAYFNVLRVSSKL